MFLDSSEDTLPQITVIEGIVLEENRKQSLINDYFQLRITSASPTRMIDLTNPVEEMMEPYFG